MPRLGSLIASLADAVAAVAAGAGAAARDDVADDPQTPPTPQGGRSAWVKMTIRPLLSAQVLTYT